MGVVCRRTTLSAWSRRLRSTPPRTTHEGEDRGQEPARELRVLDAQLHQRREVEGQDRCCRQGDHRRPLLRPLTGWTPTSPPKRTSTMPNRRSSKVSATRL